MKTRWVPLFLVSACASQTANQPPPALPAAEVQPVPAPAAAPPSLRLPEGIRPVRYAAELTVVPSQATFQGVATVDLKIDRATQTVWLNANDLDLSSATATVGGQTFTAKILPEPKDFVGLQFTSPLPAGSAQLHIEYTGKLYDKEATGAFRQKLGDDWYVYTQFEPIDARRVFPSFDEPSFKIPWQLTLDVPASDQAFSNTPAETTTTLPNGLHQVKFAETRPLPSYLIALAVGPIEAVDAGKSRRGTPVRILVPRGLSNEASWAVTATPQLLSLLEDYFDSPYPYPKLDCVAVPQQHGLAMENAGLVTFGQETILSPPVEDSIYFRRDYAETAAHELSHQWFGDLVTTAWWDDLWLNEAFATWLTPKIVDAWQPSWAEAEARIETRAVAMASDSLLTARRIRQPIQSDNDMQNAFDGITYSKGATVIGMFERLVGAERFRNGVHRYMREHADGNATATEFLAAISAEAGRDVAPAFSTFLDQAGLPVVTAAMQCGDQGASLSLSQERYVAQGVAAPEDAAHQIWQIPICARWVAGGKTGQSCTILDSRQGSLALSGAKTCPDWVLLNDGGGGYYNSLYSGDLLGRLLKSMKKLSSPERLSLIDDVSELVHAGKIPYADALALVPTLASDSSRRVAEAALQMTESLSDELLFPESLRPNYVRFVRSVFGRRAHALGWKEKRGESDDVRLLRREIVPLVAKQGEDAALRKEARKLVEAWLADHHALPSNLAMPALSVAAATGDQALFGQIHKAALAEKDPRDRARLLSALGTFRTPAIVQEALGLILTDEFDPREIQPLLWEPTETPETRRLDYDFVKTNYDALVAKLPRDAAASFPFVGARICEPGREADLEAFFRDRSAKFTGGPLMLAQALESQRQCEAFKSAQQPSVAKFLASQK